MATFLGGCSGSTSGGIKAYRLVIIASSIRSGLMRLIYPNSVRPVRYGTVAVEPEMQRTVFLFVCAYLGIWALGSIALAATGLDVETAVSGSITALANVGPGIGPVIGPSGNFSGIGDPAKLILIFLMLARPARDTCGSGAFGAGLLARIACATKVLHVSTLSIG